MPSSSIRCHVPSRFLPLRCTKYTLPLCDDISSWHEWTTKLSDSTTVFIQTVPFSPAVHILIQSRRDAKQKGRLTTDSDVDPPLCLGQLFEMRTSPLHASTSVVGSWHNIPVASPFDILPKFHLYVEYSQTFVRIVGSFAFTANCCFHCYCQWVCARVATPSI